MLACAGMVSHCACHTRESPTADSIPSAALCLEKQPWPLYGGGTDWTGRGPTQAALQQPCSGLVLSDLPGVGGWVEIAKKCSSQLGLAQIRNVGLNRLGQSDILV